MDSRLKDRSTPENELMREEIDRNPLRHRLVAAFTIGYPFPTEHYAEAVARYRRAREVVWCQEEPQNQGAWYQIRHRLQEPLSDEQELYYAGRMGAAAPAVGYYQVHVAQQEDLVEAALKGHTPAAVAVTVEADTARNSA